MNPEKENPSSPQKETIPYKNGWSQQQPTPTPMNTANQQATGNPESYTNPPSALQTAIPYKNKYALIGYYLGFLSLLPLLGAIFFIPAYIFSILGLLAVNKNPAIKGKIHAIVGIVLASLQFLGLLLLILGIFANK